MSFSNPFRDLLLPHRRCKQVFVDGFTPGLDDQTRHRGSTHAPATGHAAQHNHGGDYLGGQGPTDYDPGMSFYSSNSSHYHRPAPWYAMYVERPNR